MVGLYRHEKIAPQTIEIDLEIALPGMRFQDRKGGRHDRLWRGRGAHRSLLAKERFGLVENLAERIASLVLEDFKSPRVKISIAKLGALREAQRVG